jgi:MFS family permease
MDATENSLEPDRGLKSIVRAFSSRNYRLYFIGQGASLIGTWMQQIALIWLVYRLTRSAFLLGLVGFATQIPMMLLMPFTGVLADRWNRYRIMIVNQVLEMVEAIILAILVFTHRIAIWQIVILGMILGVVNALDGPTRHAFIVQLVEKRDDLPNAIALNSAMFNSARLIGPAIAGILIALVGEGVCFLINAVSFLAVIAALLAMRIKPQKPKPQAAESGIFRELHDGFSYTFGMQPVRLIIIHFAWVSLMGMSFTVLIPILADKILKGGVHGLGFLMGAIGAGALTGAILLAARKRTDGLWKLIALSSTIFGTSLILLSVSRNYIFSLFLMVIIGMGMTSQMTTSNTFLQTICDDSKRARVMAFYLLAFFGTIPIGNLMLGAIANWAGVPTTLLFAGIASIASSIFFAARFSALEKGEMKNECSPLPTAPNEITGNQSL